MESSSQGYGDRTIKNGDDISEESTEKGGNHERAYMWRWRTILATCWVVLMIDLFHWEHSRIMAGNSPKWRFFCALGSMLEDFVMEYHFIEDCWCINRRGRPLPAVIEVLTLMIMMLMMVTVWERIGRWIKRSKRKMRRRRSFKGPAQTLSIINDHQRNELHVWNNSRKRIWNRNSGTLNGYIVNSIVPKEEESIEIVALNEDTVIPTRTTEGSAGLDVRAACDVKVPAGKRMMVLTGIKARPPKGTYIRIAPRSGLTIKHSIDVGAEWWIETLRGS